MAKCPWCGTTIAKFFLDRKCPKCGEQLGESKSIGNATLATIEGVSPEDAVEKLEGEGKNDTIGTVDILPNAEIPARQTPAGELTVAEGDGQLTVDQFDDVSPNAFSKDATVGEGDLTVDSDSFNRDDSVATVDAGALSKSDSEMTLDAPTPAADSGSDGSGGQLTFGGEEYGSSSSIYKSAEIRQIWEKAAGSSADPQHSLQKGAVQVTDSVFEKISVRNLNLNPNVAVNDADYHIRFELGRGKQGVVYAAKQKGLGRTVAIKLVIKGPAGSVERDKLNRFVREAEITAALDHPNILPIHELAVTSGGELFYSMKKVEGEAWNDIIDDNKKTLDENVECLLKVCDAIAFAHSKQVIHRDLKPGNIMIGGFGEVLVADWGMAVDLNKSLDFKPTPQQKDPFSFGGTPAYMSPEMAKHDWPKIGTRSDIYLLGAILYHLIEGRPPRDGRSVYEVLDRARSNFYFPVEDESGLMAVALKAMEASPTDRYETVEDFQEAIREVNRHAESSRLSDHAEGLLKEAIDKSDYGKFNESIFSFRNAIDLWRDNRPAHEGLKRARLAYSENALSRGDFDVCLDTLDGTAADERELYAKAKAAQTEARNRELRYRRLRRTSVIGALVAFAGLSGLSLWLTSSLRQVSLQNTEIAQKNDEIGEANKSLEAKQKELVTKNETLDKQANELIQSNKEIKERSEQIEKQSVEIKQKSEALAAETIQKEAQRLLAVQKSLEAQANERTAKLGSYQSSLLSAYNLAQSYNVRRSNALLGEIRDIQTSMLLPTEAAAVDGSEKTPMQAVLAQSPPLVTWPYRRVAALIGRDIPQLDWDHTASCLDVAAAAPIAVIGSAEDQSSQLQVVTMDGRSISVVPDLSLAIDRDVVSVAVSPDGKEVVYVPEGNNTSQPGVYHWDLASKQVNPFNDLRNMNFRWVAFSPDGKQLLIGINNGIYRLPRNGKIDVGAAKFVKYECRGELLNIQFVEDQGEIKKAICTAFLDVPTRGTKELACYELDLSSSDIRFLNIPDELATEATVATVIDAAGRVCLGTIDGRLLVLERGKSDGRMVELSLVGELEPRVHATRILAIRPHGSDRMITIGQDNALQLWRKGKNEESSGWIHERALVGLQDLAVDGRFFQDGQRVMAIDQRGVCVDWDLKDIADRQRMEAPPSASGIVANGGTGKQGRNWWVDREGILRNWGTGVAPDLERNLFPGHTPKADFADFAWSNNADRMVTASRLTLVTTPFRDTTETMIEFCTWEISTGKMLSRWTRASETVPRMALVDDGKRLLWVNENQAVISDLDGGNEALIQDGGRNILAVEVVPNPVSPNLIALVGGKGAVWMVDVAANQAILNSNSDIAFQVADIRTLKATWNPTGDRLYILRSTSDNADLALTSLDWKENKLARNSVYNDRLDGLKVSASQNKLENHIADLNVGVGPNNSEVVSVAVRHRFNVGPSQFRETWVATVKFVDGSKPEVSAQQLENKVWLTADSRLVTQDELSGQFGNVRRNFSKVMFGLNNRLAVVMQLRTGRFLPIIADTKDRAAPNRTYGRTGCKMASGDSLGNRWLTLHEEGELWQANVNAQGGIDWTRIPERFIKEMGLLKTEFVAISPDGQLALLAGTSAQGPRSIAVNLAELKQLKAWDGFSIGSWQPTGERLAIASTAGQVKVFTLADGNEFDSQMVIDKVQVTSPNVSRVTWFREVLSTVTSSKSNWYLLAQVGERNLQFVPVPTGEVAVAESKFETMNLDSPITAVACSPLDNTIAVGTSNGNISTWFASPTVDPRPRELFSIDAHRGSVVNDLNFSKDGYTLFSADAPENIARLNNRGRGYGWLTIRLPEENAEPLANR
jgi:serine/threonine protein kinase/WD40 repeat protein